MLIIDIEVIRDIEKNDERRRLDCSINETEKKKTFRFSMKENEIFDF